MTPLPTASPTSAPAWAEYRRRVEDLRAQYHAIPPGAPVRLAKKTSNLFRTRSRPAAPGLDVAAFDGVLEVDPVARTADVCGMTTYEHLVDATLAHGLMPAVVPELKTITIGGAVTGLGIESSSFRNGMPHESVVELDVLTGDGRVLTVRPDGEHGDLFHGFPNSYGTLGYALRLRIELEPVHPYVHLRHVAFPSVADLVGPLKEVCETRQHQGEPVDFVDGTVFGPDECYLTLGSWADHAPATSDYTGAEIYYRSLQTRGAGLAHGARLPVAVGHRLVLVLPGVRRPAQMGAPAGRAPLAPQRRVLADRRLRGAPPPQGGGGPAARTSPTGECDPGRRGAGRTAGRVRRRLPPGRAHRPHLAVPVAPAPTATPSGSFTAWTPTSCT